MKFCILLLTIIVLHFYGHTQVHIKGNVFFLPGAEGKIRTINVMSPIGIYPQPWYADSSDHLNIQSDGTVCATIPLPRAGLIFFALATGQEFRSFVEPGDTLNFTISIDSNRSARWTFLAKDSFCDNYLNEMNPKINSAIRQLYRKKYDPMLLANQVDSFVKGEQNYVRTKIQSARKAEFLSLSIESVTLWVMINLYGHATAGSPNKENYDLICKELYRRFNPLQTKYIVTRTAMINVEALANEMKEQPNFVSTIRFQQPDSGWSRIDEDFEKVSTFPEPFREGQLGDYILMGAIRFKNRGSKKAMFYFARQYPQSAFLPVFSAILASDTSGSPGKDFSLVKTNDTLQSKIFFVNENLSLKTVLDKYAKGKPVIIDCWATWCIHCIAEFPFYAQHSSYLDENNVVKLFLSYDVPSNAGGWEEIARAWKLDGVHVLGNKALQADFARLIKYPIDKPLPLPRYIVLNSEHEVTDYDMIRPSDPDFEQKLSKDLKRKAVVSSNQ